MIRKVLWVGVPVSVLIAMLGLMTWAAQSANMPVVDPSGTIGTAQRDTLYTATLIMSLIVIPVFLLTLFIAIRYRAGNKKAVYTPEWASSKKLEFIWWGVPILIVTVLSVITWQTSHSLDPYKPLVSDKKPVEVQVIALQYKWLFIYPEENVASVNELTMPVATPINFTVTSDAPMNSFWIPQLGGQIYAMAGMSTKLHLDASKPGDYRGVSANLSGEGHADMDFVVRARSEQDFQSWVTKAAASKDTLDAARYEKLRNPGSMEKVSYFKVSGDIYDASISRYHTNEHNGPQTHNSEANQ